MDTIKQITDYIIKVGESYYYESDEEDYYYLMTEITFDEWGIPEDYTLDISQHIKTILKENN